MQYNQFWGAGLILIGLLLAFAGNKFVYVTIFVICSVAVTSIGLFFTFTIIDKYDINLKTYVEWIIVAVFILLGLAVGAFLAKLRKIGISIMAAWGGVMIGFLITTMFVMKNVYMYYGIIIACALILFFFAYKVETIVIIMITSFIGSYSCIRGISMYVGNFPDET